MRPIRLATTGLLILAAFLVMSADAPPQAVKPDDGAVLQGAWVLQTVEWLGEESDQGAEITPLDWRCQALRSRAEERELKPDMSHRMTLRIERNSFVVRQHGRTVGKGQFKLLLDKGRKVMQARTRTYRYHIHEASSSVFSNEATWHFLYSLNGDTLKLCTRHGFAGKGRPNDLPANFSTDRDENVVVLTFKRENAA